MFGSLLCVFLMCSVAGLTSGQTVMNFCSGKSIHGSVSARSEEVLIFDGSDAAITSQDLPYGITTCACSITYDGLQVPESSGDENISHTSDKENNYDGERPLPRLLVQSSADGIYDCGKSVKVTQIGEKVVRWLGYKSRGLDFQEIPPYGTIKMTFSVEIPKPKDTLYQMILKTGGQTVEFFVTCLPPVLPRTTPSPSSGLSTLKTPGDTKGDPQNTLSNGSDNTGIVAGIVTSNAVISIVIIVGVVCIRRRRRLKNDNHCDAVQENKNVESKDVDKQKDVTQDNYYITLESSKDTGSQRNADTESGIYDFIRPEDVGGNMPDGTNEYDSIPRDNDSITRDNTEYDQLRLSELHSSTYSKLGSEKAYVNTKERSKVNHSAKTEHDLGEADGYLEPGKLIPNYLEILPN